MLLNCQILKRQAQLLKQGWQGFPKRGDGECLSTSWKFAYTPPGEISPAKFFLVLYQKFQHVEYYLSRISISRNIKLKKCEIQFFSHFGKFLKIFLKTYGTLKIFLWSAQNNFTLYWVHILKDMWKKIKVWISCLRLVFWLLKSLSGRHNSIP